jgi:hypothetical protein
MDHYFSVAFYESLWRVILALLISAILIVCFGSNLSTALQIAAHMALLFALLMIRNAFQLAQMLADYYSNGRGKPLRVAQNRPAALMLQFAKAGSALAIGLYGAALVT